MKIAVCQPHFIGKETHYAQQAVRSGWIASGPFVERFENAFSAYCGMPHGVAVSSGTAALHVALRALQVGPGDEVIIPDFSMAAVLFSVLYVGATPVPVDAELDTWNIDALKIEAKITRKTKAIIVVHTYGHPCDMDPILKIARKHRLRVIEDAAEAHGARYKGRRAGSLADIACFSFYANKIITTGEGGMVLTREPRLRDRCRRLRNLFFPLDRERDFRHDELAYNYRLGNVAAAIGLAQFENIGKLIALRKRNASVYSKILSGVRGIQLPVQKKTVENVYWMFGLLVTDEAKLSRNELRRALAAKGIETRPFFHPLHLQKTFPKRGNAPKDYPVSRYLGEHGFYLPSGSNLRLSELERIGKTLKQLLK